MKTWARPVGYPEPNPLHLVCEDEGDSIVTWCDGRFVKSDGFEQVTGVEPAPNERCRRCDGRSKEAA